MKINNVYTEDYVIYCKNRRTSLLAQVRLAILPLHIVTVDSEKNCQNKECVLFVIRCRG